ncbi:MAG TPA: hypothetical protein VFY18_03015 [Candidatus Limnocylindrales bacterium]|nr:hypothetical protein [Candidatus Limnocylindrales bacterium]
MRRILLAICLGSIVAAGCGMWRVLPTTNANRFEGAPAIVRDRVALPPCGEEAVRGDGVVNLAGRRCLWTAYLEHRPAEFVTTQWSVEGDPITSIYRVLPGGSVEVFIDSTQDVWSARTWLRLACPGLSLIEGAAGQPAFGPGLGSQPDGECVETTIS